MKKQTGKSCYGCVNYMNAACNVRPGIENLKQWPFKNTQCASFTRGIGVAAMNQPNTTSVIAPHSTPNRQGSFMSIDFWKTK